MTGSLEASGITEGKIFRCIRKVRTYRCFAHESDSKLTMLVPDSGRSTLRQTAQKCSTQGRTSISHDQTLRGCASKCT
ncbi:hypothetical protein BH11PSE13_BH11PSE13_45640 [soil metagenome]